MDLAGEEALRTSVFDPQERIEMVDVDEDVGVDLDDEAGPRTGPDEPFQHQQSFVAEVSVVVDEIPLDQVSVNDLFHPDSLLHVGLESPAYWEEGQRVHGTKYVTGTPCFPHQLANFEVLWTSVDNDDEGSRLVIIRCADIPWYVRCEFDGDPRKGNVPWGRVDSSGREMDPVTLKRLELKDEAQKEREGYEERRQLKASLGNLRPNQARHHGCSILQHTA